MHGTTTKEAITSTPQGNLDFVVAGDQISDSQETQLEGGNYKDLDTRANVASLRFQLESLGLESRGQKKELKQRLSQFKKHGAKWLEAKMEEERRENERKDVDIEWVLVIDFECTCEASTRSTKNQSNDNDDDDERKSRPSTAESTATSASTTNEAQLFEIIEFPIVLINLPERRIVDTFQTYIKPSINPILSDFCTELTGITQAQVDNAPTFPEALQLVNDWLVKTCTPHFTPHIMDDTINNKYSKKGYHKSKNPGKGSRQFKGPRYRNNRNWCIATDGRMDLEGFLTAQLDRDVLHYRPWTLGPYLDSRTWFANFSRVSRTSCKLLDQLAWLKLEFEGREHSGLSDARNIARVILGVCQRGGKVVCNRYMEEIERGWMPGQKLVKTKKQENEISRVVDELD